MKEPTKEELEVIRYRQMHCEHRIIRGPSDTTPRCVHCGISQSDAEQMQSVPSFNPYGWAPSAGGIP